MGGFRNEPRVKRRPRNGGFFVALLAGPAGDGLANELAQQGVMLAYQWGKIQIDRFAAGGGDRVPPDVDVVVSTPDLSVSRRNRDELVYKVKTQTDAFAVESHRGTREICERLRRYGFEAPSIIGAPSQLVASARAARAAEQVAPSEPRLTLVPKREHEPPKLELRLELNTPTEPPEAVSEEPAVSTKKKTGTVAVRPFTAAERAGADALKAARLRNGITSTRLAETIGVNKTAISGIETYKSRTSEVVACGLEELFGLPALTIPRSARVRNNARIHPPASWAKRLGMRILAPGDDAPAPAPAPTAGAVEPASEPRVAPAPAPAPAPARLDGMRIAPPGELLALLMKLPGRLSELGLARVEITAQGISMVPIGLEPEREL